MRTWSDDLKNIPILAPLYPPAWETRQDFVWSWMFKSHESFQLPIKLKAGGFLSFNCKLCLVLLTMCSHPRLPWDVQNTKEQFEDAFDANATYLQGFPMMISEVRRTVRTLLLKCSAYSRERGRSKDLGFWTSGTISSTHPHDYQQYWGLRSIIAEKKIFCVGIGEHLLLELIDVVGAYICVCV